MSGVSSKNSDSLTHYLQTHNFPSAIDSMQGKQKQQLMTLAGWLDCRDALLDISKMLCQQLR
jgi:hypothetical protein